MRIKRIVVVGLVCGLLSPAFCMAEDQVDCSSSCPSDKVMVSFADGNSVTCSCMPAASMEETVPDVNPDYRDEDNPT